MWNYKEWITETDPAVLQKAYDQLLRDSGFGVCKFIEHHFTPFGYTAIWLLSESHFAIHTFPEEGKAYIELTSCVKKQFDKFIYELSLKTPMNK